MTIAIQPIFTQVVGAGTPGNLTFNNIPQTFTDLKLVTSTRDSSSSDFNVSYLRFNNETTGTNYSDTLIIGYNNTNFFSSRITNASYISDFWTDGNNATASTFASADFYIPNYRSSNFKSVIIDSASEVNSASGNTLSLTAGLWRNTAAITSLTLISSGYIANSTFTLYGITKG